MFLIQKTDIFDKWLTRLRDLRGKAKILNRIKRAELGNLGDNKALGDGLFEMRVKYGPGCRIYFMKIENRIIILILGGDKSSQEKDIRKAKEIMKEIEEQDG